MKAMHDASQQLVPCTISSYLHYYGNNDSSLGHMKNIVGFRLHVKLAGSGVRHLGRITIETITRLCSTRTVSGISAKTAWRSEGSIMPSFNGVRKAIDLENRNPKGFCAWLYLTVDDCHRSLCRCHTCSQGAHRNWLLVDATQ